MTSPEKEPGAGFEYDPIKLPLRVTLFFKFLHMLEKAQQRRNRAQQLKDARAYERQAEKASTSSSAAIFLLSAGRAYMNAHRNNQALERFEEARPGLEAYKMGGTLEGFSTLSGLYQALEFVHRAAGNESSAEEIHEKSVALAREKEQYFGIHTEFLEGGGQLISSVKRLPESSAGQVEY